MHAQKMFILREEFNQEKIRKYKKGYFRFSCWVSYLFLVSSKHFPTAMIVADKPLGGALPLAKRVALVQEWGETGSERLKDISLVNSQQGPPNKLTF